MDGEERRRKQYGQPPYSIPSPSSASSAQRMSYQPGERYIQGLQSTTRGEGSQAAMSRSATLPGYGYGYAEQQGYQVQPIQSSGLQYQPGFSRELGAHQQQSQQPQQLPSQPQYPQYGGQVLYNVGQAGSSQIPYDPGPQFQQRQSAAIEVLSNQFGVSPYYATGEPASAGVPAGQTHFIASQPESAQYIQQQTPPGRPAMPQSFNVEMTHYSPMQPAGQPPQEQVPADNMDEAYSRYQQQLKLTYEAISAGRLSEASEKILNLSRWLLSNVARLGLQHDASEGNPQFDPVQVWKDFNICWLALGQRQKDLVEEMLRFRTTNANALAAETIQAIVDELIRLCDPIEQYGLVDYDRGVWEEEIVNVFSQCLDLVEGAAPPTTQAAATFPVSRPP